MTGAPTHVENFVPFDFVGTADDGSGEAWLSSSVANGTHTITQAVSPTSGAVQTLTATFTVGPASTYTLLVSTSPSRGSASALSGASLSGSVYIFTSDGTHSANPAGISKVSYWLDNPAMTGAATHVENFVPFDFVGTADDGSAEAWSTSSVSAGKPYHHAVGRADVRRHREHHVDVHGDRLEQWLGHRNRNGRGWRWRFKRPLRNRHMLANGSRSRRSRCGERPGSQVPAFPKLSSPFTVTGLDASGNDDVGPIIQAALNAHGQVIIPGSGSFGSPSRYNVATQVNVPEGAIIECETGAEFLDATPCEGNMAGLFLWSGTASVQGAGMYGCMFRGTAANILVPTSYNHSFIRLNTASNYTIEGNFTTNSCGDADIRLDGPENSASNHGSTHNLIAFNDIENAENGIGVINGWNNTVMCNTAFNGGLVDEEPNQSYPQCGQNTYTKNYEEQTMSLSNYQMGTSIGGNGTSCPSGSGVCATDIVTDNVFNANGFSNMGVDCECNADGDACDNASFGGQWSGNILVGGTKCSCGSACGN